MKSSDEILGVLSAVAETDEVRHNPELALFETHLLDSMRTVELLLAVGQELGVEISPAEFDRETWSTPRKFVEDIQSRSAGS